MHEDLENSVAAGKVESAVAEKIDALSPGTICNHRSWGVGRVKEWDLIGGRITIDFEDKPDHGMALKFAADSLEPIEDGHFLSMRFAQKDELVALAQSDPVDLVALAVDSAGGSVSLDKLEEMIKGSVVEEGAYKRWWEGAKRKLRTDRRFVVPAKRNEPLEMRDSDVTPADSLTEDYNNARDLKSKAKAVDAILKELSAFDNPEEQLRPVIEDINDTARKSLRLQLTQAVELVLVRNELQNKKKGLRFDEDELSLGEILSGDKSRAAELFETMPVSRQRLVLRAFESAFPDTWVDELLQLFNSGSLRTIGEAATLLNDNDKGAELKEFLETGLQQRTLSSDALAWICRERNKQAKEIFNPEIGLAVMSALEQDSLEDETGRAANRLRDLMSDDVKLIPDLIEAADKNLVRNFARRLMMSSIFEELTRKSLMARVVKLHPFIQDLITGGADDAKKVKKAEPLVVSVESYHKKKADFEDLVNKRIPQNREEIKIAREYGDLRENFEYKAAKEQQRVLARMQDEGEIELELAQPTDFAGADTSEVSIGTIVSLRNSDNGEEEKYTILGAWDSDPEKRIVAYLTGVGQKLIGTKVGETVELPTSDEDRTQSFEVTAIEAYNKG
jgi:transcription elongation GreA/GreB family factor